MSPGDFYDALARHDWHYSQSDDSSVYNKGHNETLRLQRVRDTSPCRKDLRRIWDEWSRHIFQDAPRPERPR